MTSCCRKQGLLRDNGDMEVWNPFNGIWNWRSENFVIRLFVSTICRFLAPQCVQESCLGNSPHVARDVQLPSTSYSTSLHSNLTLSFTLACCSATYKPESTSFVVINSWILTDYSWREGSVTWYIVRTCWCYTLGISTVATKEVRHGWWILKSLPKSYWLVV